MELEVDIAALAGFSENALVRRRMMGEESGDIEHEAIDENPAVVDRAVLRDLRHGVRGQIVAAPAFMIVFGGEL